MGTNKLLKTEISHIRRIQTLVNKNVFFFSLDLKESMEGADLIGMGMLFHSLGATTAKARSPLSLSFDRGTAKSPESANLRDLKVDQRWSEGTSPFKALKTNRRTINQLWTALAASRERPELL